MFSAALVTTTQAATAVSTVIQQLKADAVTLLIILAGVFAITFVVELAKSFMHGATTTYGAIGGSSDKAWTKFVQDNERTIRRARAASAESDRLMKKTRSEW